MIIYIDSQTPTILSMLTPISLFDLVKIGFIKVIGGRVFSQTPILHAQYPYSLFSITKLSNLNNYKIVGDEVLQGIFYDWDHESISKFLNQLNDDKIYATPVEFVQNYQTYDIYNPFPKVLLSDPIVITKTSDPEVISKFIIGQLNKLDPNQSIFNKTDSNSVILFYLLEINVN